MKTLDREELLANLIKNAECPEIFCALQRLKTYLSEDAQSLSLTEVGVKFGLSFAYSHGVMDGWDSVVMPGVAKAIGQFLMLHWENTEYSAGRKFGERMARECLSDVSITGIAKLYNNILNATA